MTKKKEEVVESPEVKLAEISKEVVKVTKTANSIVVKTQEDVVKATDFLGGVKARLKRVEELRTFFVKPLNEQVKQINNMFKAQSEPLESVERQVKRAISDYMLEQDRIARAEEERLAKLRAKQDERREEKGLEPIQTPLATVDRPESTTKTENGKSTASKVWKFEIEAYSEIPKKFVEDILTLAREAGLYERVIRKAVANGEREIKGVRIYEDFDVKVSAR